MTEFEVNFHNEGNPSIGSFHENVIQKNNQNEIVFDRLSPVYPTARRHKSGGIQVITSSME